MPRAEHVCEENDHANRREKKRVMFKRVGMAAVIALLGARFLPSSTVAAKEVSLSQNLQEVDTYDFVEVSVAVSEPDVSNPFAEVRVNGVFAKEGGSEKRVIGFCDSEDGSLFKIRFMPAEPGDYLYSVSYLETQGLTKEFKGRFRARRSDNKGIVRVDPEHPFHLVYEGTGEHYFYNGTTAYHLLSWTDEERMLRCIERIASTSCNRVRFLNYGRASDNEWGEGMVQSKDFVWTLCPWPARHPTRQLREGSPEFDHARFNLAHWRKCERALSRMRELNVVASVIMLMDRGIADAPPAGSELEKRYYRYAVARYGAFSNVMWDLGNEHNEYRGVKWANETGGLMKKWDAYHHLISAHGHAAFPYDLEEWADFAIYQRWADGQNAFMLEQRTDAVQKGRRIPQVNEEYGYEKHKGSGQDEVRRRAWEIVMAGCYQTTGEWKGWQHGEATAGSRILNWTGLMRTFFERNLPWWEMDPANEVIRNGTAYALALEGKCYAAYLPEAEKLDVTLAPGTYDATWFNPRSGDYEPIREKVSGGRWRSPNPPSSGDWVLLIVSSR
jgi:hypothetical protein